MCCIWLSVHTVTGMEKSFFQQIMHPVTKFMNLTVSLLKWLPYHDSCQCQHGSKSLRFPVSSTLLNVCNKDCCECKSRSNQGVLRLKLLILCLNADYFSFFPQNLSTLKNRSSSLASMPLESSSTWTAGITADARSPRSPWSIGR